MYDTNTHPGRQGRRAGNRTNLIKAAAPYVNVFSIEDYCFKQFDQAVDAYWPPYLPQQQNLPDLEAVANIPLMIGEYSFMSNSSDPNTSRAFIAADSRQQRANEFENFIAPCTRIRRRSSVTTGSSTSIAGRRP